MLTSFDSAFCAYCKIEIFVLGESFQISETVLSSSGRSITELEEPCSYENLLVAISEFICDVNPPSAFTVDGVDFPINMPNKYLHAALRMLQRDGSLEGTFRSRVLKLAEEYSCINV